VRAGLVRLVIGLLRLELPEADAGPPGFLQERLLSAVEALETAEHHLQCVDQVSPLGECPRLRWWGRRLVGRMGHA